MTTHKLPATSSRYASAVLALLCTSRFCKSMMSDHHSRCRYALLDCLLCELPVFFERDIATVQRYLVNVEQRRRLYCRGSEREILNYSADGRRRAKSIVESCDRSALPCRRQPRTWSLAIVQRLAKVEQSRQPDRADRARRLPLTQEGN